MGFGTLDQIENDCVDHDPIQPFKSDVDSTPAKTRKRKLRNSHDNGNATVITPGINIDDVLKAELDNDSMAVVDVNHDILNQSGSDNGMSEFDLSNFYDPEESSNFKLIMDSLDSTVRFREVSSITTTKQNSLVICTGCDKQMGYYSWKQHVIAIHAKLKPYVCHDCGYNTSVRHIIRPISYGPYDIKLSIHLVVTYIQFIQHFRHHQRKIHQKTITNYRSRKKDRVEDYQKYKVDDDIENPTNNLFSTIEAT